MQHDEALVYHRSSEYAYIDEPQCRSERAPGCCSAHGPRLVCRRPSLTRPYASVTVQYMVLLMASMQGLHSSPGHCQTSGHHPRRRLCLSRAGLRSSNGDSTRLDWSQDDGLFLLQEAKTSGHEIHEGRSEGLRSARGRG